MIKRLQMKSLKRLAWNLRARVSDYVNGLSLTLDSKPFFLDISAINAILRIIAYITPGFRMSIQQHQASIASDKAGECPRREIIQYDEGQLIDAYTAHNSMYCVTPIIDESDFRSGYSCRGDQRPHWLALLNMVFAMGSISTSEPDEQSHKIYYAKANEYLSFNSLGNGHLETVQALGLIGGYYCYYLNQPNMANVIMGAALRMAVAMALHLERVSRTIDPTASRDS
ncbi:hypothetical protein CJF32_00009733 [Rutstroemia sp. NJR-2017a WRK4]|nr:hypothetical protein CJF32_00009733 [Rutstroemia sp. NJR-2017a WRK4]